MSAASALGYLVAVNLKARARQLVRRVRSPRHFFAMLAGLGWLAYLVVVNLASAGRTAQVPGLDTAWAFELLLLLSLAFAVVMSWTLMPAGALGFTQGEINLLFAAPIGRRALVAYKLVQQGVATGLGVVLVVALFGRGAAADRGLSALSGWLVIMIANVHGAGAVLTRAAVGRGSASRARALSLAALAALATFAVALALSWRWAPAADTSRGVAAAALEWTRGLVHVPPLAWILYPVRAPLDVAFGSRGTGAAVAYAAAGAALIAHLAWIFWTDAAFEEVALANAEKMAARLAAVSQGALPIARAARKRRFVEIAGEGAPEWALVWKALVRATRVISIRLIALLATMVLCVTVATFFAWKDGGRGVAALVGFMSLVVLGISAFYAPFVFSGDLRADSGRIEVLRALPLAGQRVIAGEMVLPLAQALLLEWTLVAVWFVGAGVESRLLFPAHVPELGVRLALALALAVAAPLVSGAVFLIANGLVVLYPDWFGASDQRKPGFDPLGMQNLVGILTLLGATLVLLPAGTVGLAVGRLSLAALDVWALPVGAAAAAAVFALCGMVALRILGRAFERIDLSE